MEQNKGGSRVPVRDCHEHIIDGVSLLPVVIIYLAIAEKALLRHGPDRGIQPRHDFQDTVLQRKLELLRGNKVVGDKIR